MATRENDDDVHKGLTADERRTIRAIERDLRKTGVPKERSPLETGRLLLEARSILEKYGVYTHWLKHFDFNYRTALRRTDAYATLQAKLGNWPKVLVEEASETGFRFPGTLNELPTPPRSMTKRQAREYLANLNQQYDQRVAEIMNDPQRVLKECFRSIENRVSRISAAKREKFCNDLVGMMMTLMGMTDEKEFLPKPIPEEFRADTQRFERSPEVREKIGAAARARWERIRGGK